MGNIISNDKVDEDLYLRMSNGATSVFIALLALSGSALAQTENEIRMITCIASRDQSVFGIGVVGFDLCALPWSHDADAFSADKRFLVKTIHRAMAQTDWHKLDYSPAVDRALENQEKFLEMVERFQLDHLEPFNPDKFYLPDEMGARCSKHGVFLHPEGCVVCNDT